MKAPRPVKIVVLVTLLIGLLCGALWKLLVHGASMGPIEAGVRCGFAVGALTALALLGSWWMDKIDDLEEKARERRDR